jgi:hypothetical protein
VALVAERCQVEREREGEDKVREKEDIIQEDAFGSSVFFQRAL